MLLRRSALAVLLAALFGLPPTALAQRPDFDHEEVVERRFRVQPGQTLYLDSDLGQVRVTGTAGREVAVTVVEGADGVSRREAEDYFERFTVDFRESRRGLEIAGDYDRPRSARRWGSRLRVYYEITVPRDLNVEIQTAGGAVQVAGVEGEARLKTSGGSIDVREVAGPVEAHTSGGSITARSLGGPSSLRTSGGSIDVFRLNGRARLHTSGGSITARDVHGPVEAQTSGGSIQLREIFGAVDAHTSGGSVTAEVVGQPEGPMSLRTSGGTVTLVLDRDVRADVDAVASGGRVRSDLPVAVRGEIGRGRLQGELNGGGPLVRLRASGGSVRLQER